MSRPVPLLTSIAGGTGDQVDVDRFLENADKSWIRKEAILYMLQNMQHLNIKIETEPLAAPTSGTVVFFDRITTPEWRKDGLRWKGTSDRQEKIRVYGSPVLICSYRHSSDDPDLHRRGYWLVGDDAQHVLVQYLKKSTSAEATSALSATITRGPRASSGSSFSSSSSSSSLSSSSSSSLSSSSLSLPLPASAPTLVSSSSSASSSTLPALFKDSVSPKNPSGMVGYSMLRLLVYWVEGITTYASTPSTLAASPVSQRRLSPPSVTSTAAASVTAPAATTATTSPSSFTLTEVFHLTCPESTFPLPSPPPFLERLLLAAFERAVATNLDAVVFASAHIRAVVPADILLQCSFTPVHLAPFVMMVAPSYVSLGVYLSTHLPLATLSDTSSEDEAYGDGVDSGNEEKVTIDDFSCVGMAAADMECVANGRSEQSGNDGMVVDAAATATTTPSATMLNDMTGSKQHGIVAAAAVVAGAATPVSSFSLRSSSAYRPVSPSPDPQQGASSSSSTSSATTAFSSDNSTVATATTGAAAAAAAAGATPSIAPRLQALSSMFSRMSLEDMGISCRDLDNHLYPAASERAQLSEEMFEKAVSRVQRQIRSWLYTRHNAAKKIQSFMRGAVARRGFQELKKAVTTVQSTWRRRKRRRGASGIDTYTSADGLSDHDHLLHNDHHHSHQRGHHDHVDDHHDHVDDHHDHDGDDDADDVDGEEVDGISNDHRHQTQHHNHHVHQHSNVPHPHDLHPLNAFNSHQEGSHQAVHLHQQQHQHDNQYHGQHQYSFDRAPPITTPSISDHVHDVSSLDPLPSSSLLSSSSASSSSPLGMVYVDDLYPLEDPRQQSQSQSQSHAHQIHHYPYASAPTDSLSHTPSPLSGMIATYHRNTAHHHQQHHGSHHHDNEHSNINNASILDVSISSSLASSGNPTSLSSSRSSSNPSSSLLPATTSTSTFFPSLFSSSSPSSYPSDPVSLRVSLMRPPPLSSLSHATGAIALDTTLESIMASPTSPLPLL